MTDEELEDIYRRVYTEENIRNRDPFAVITADEAAGIYADERTHSVLIRLLCGLEREAYSGLRCGVCAMTHEQADAAGYDCVRQC